MDFTTLKLNIHPTENQLEMVRNWLLQEDENRNEGYICEWNQITTAFHEHRLLLFQNQDGIYGFVTWEKYPMPYVSISRMEIHPEFRKQGIGDLFFWKSIDFFRLSGFVAVILLNLSEENEKLAKKMDFKEIHLPIENTEKFFFMPLIATNEPTKEHPKNRFELWKSSEIAENQAPHYVWEYEHGHFPIFLPCDKNWRFQLIKENITVRSARLADLDTNDDLFFGPFLFIEGYDFE